MPQQFGSFPFDSIHVDNYAHPQFINANRAPTSNDIYQPGTRWQDSSVTPKIIYETTGSGDWQSGGNVEATTTQFGIVELATLSELQNGNAPGDQVPTANDVATVIAGVVAGAVPPANESQAGIAEIATQAETDAGTDDTRIVTPLKLATFVSSGGGNGSFVDLTATGTVSFTGATGGITMTSATASSLGVTGAGIDLTLDSAAGRVIIDGGEAAVNAVQIDASDVAGGIDVNAGSGGITVDTTGAISIDSATASNITVTGATEDLTLASVGGSVLVSSTENVAQAIRLHANGGTSETIQIHSDQGTGVASVGLLSDVGGITLSAPGLASNDAINITAGAGGVDIDAALQVNIATSQSAADAIVVSASAGGIDITATGTAGEDIDILASGSSVNVTATENAAQAIYIRANGGTSETIDIHADQGTGAASIVVHSDVGGVTITSGLASADAINIVASDAGGGIDIDAGTAGVIVDTTGGISLDSAAASNFTATGAFDLTLNSTAGSVIINGEEAVADAIQIQTAAGGIDIDSALEINISSSEAAVADSITIDATAADGGVTISAGTGNVNITGTDLVVSTGDISTTAGSITAATTLTATLGDITATDGDVVLGTAGNKIMSTSVGTTTAAGANSFGTVTLVGGTATVATTSVTTNSIVLLTRQTIGATGAAALGLISRGTIVNGTSFVINALDPADATALIATDVSVVGYMIIN